MTKDLSGQIKDIVRQVGVLAKDLDSRSLQVRESLEGSVDDLGFRLESVEKEAADLKIGITEVKKELHHEILKLEDYSIEYRRVMQDTNKLMESKLTELNGQMITKVGNLDKRTQSLDSKCMQVKESFQVAVNRIEATVKELKKCNSESSHKQTRMEEQISSMCLKHEHLQKEGENVQKFRQVVNVKLLNLENKIDEAVKTETRNRSTEIKSLRSELESLGRDLHTNISKVVDLQLNLDAVSKTMNQRCNQVQTTLLAKVNQLLTETEQTNTAIKQCKQDTQEVKQVQADINSQISAIGPKQSYFQIQVDELLTKVKKCEAKFREVSDLTKNMSAVLVKQTEVDGIVMAIRTQFQGLHSRLSDMDKNHSDVVVSLKERVEGIVTDARTEFHGLHLRLSDMDKNHSDVVVSLRELDGILTAVRNEFQGLHSRLFDMDKNHSDVVVSLREVDGILTAVRTEFQGLHSRLFDMDKNHSDLMVSLKERVDGIVTEVRTAFEGLYKQL